MKAAPGWFKDTETERIAKMHEVDHIFGTHGFVVNLLQTKCKVISCYE